MDPSNFERVEALILETFREVAAAGFDPIDIDAVLHQIELAQKHQSSNFGLNLGMGLLQSWNHNGDPVENLQVRPRNIRAESAFLGAGDCAVCFQRCRMCPKPTSYSGGVPLPIDLGTYNQVHTTCSTCSPFDIWCDSPLSHELMLRV